MNLLGLRGIGIGKVAEVVWDVARGRHRSLPEDAAYIVSRLPAPPRVEGLEWVPPREPFLLVANHYQVPGLWVGWVVAAITDAVLRSREPDRRQLHWVITSEWRWSGKNGRSVPVPLTSILFPRACRVWELVSTAANPADVAARARSLRQVLAYLRGRHRGEPGRVQPAPDGEAVALFPEGRATVAMESTRPGAGAFLHHVSRMGVPLLPVGVYPASGALMVRIGAPFSLGDPPPGEKDVDRWAGRRTMTAIGRLLPKEMWGVYAADLGAEREDGLTTEETESTEMTE